MLLALVSSLRVSLAQPLERGTITGSGTDDTPKPSIR
jgi:hypothetical protein